MCRRQSKTFPHSAAWLSASYAPVLSNGSAPSTPVYPLQPVHIYTWIYTCIPGETCIMYRTNTHTQIGDTYLCLQSRPSAPQHSIDSSAYNHDTGYFHIRTRQEGEIGDSSLLLYFPSKSGLSVWKGDQWLFLWCHHVVSNEPPTQTLQHTFQTFLHFHISQSGHNLHFTLRCGAHYHPWDTNSSFHHRCCLVG